MYFYPNFRISDQCPVKQKMIYASSKDALKKACTGFKEEVQCNEANDITLENFIEKIMKLK